MHILIDASFAEIGVDEAHAVGETGGRLHFAADQQRVLLRDQQLPIVGNLPPAGTFYQRAGATDTACASIFQDADELLGRDDAAVVFAHIRQQLRLYFC